MNTERTDYNTKVNLKLITQAARYYNQSRIRLEVYREMEYHLLEEVAQKHLMHWKKELRELIFSDMDGGAI